MSAEALVSVVIVSYNTSRLIQRCVASALSVSVPVEVIVVDNCSSDGSPDAIASGYPGVTLIRNDRNVGFAAATNQGIAISSGRFVMLLNPDAQLLPGALETLVGFLEGHPRVAVVGPQLRYPDGTRQHSCFRFPTLLMSFFDFFPMNHRIVNSRLNGRYPWPSSAVPFPVDHPLGACMLVRREAIDEVGPLDDGFFIYCEEVDWCWRMKKAGWEVYCVPEAVVVHHEAQSTRQRAPAMFFQLHKSRKRLFEKHRSPLFRWTSRQIVRLGVAREMRRRRSELNRGELDSEKYGEWMRSYRETMAL